MAKVVCFGEILMRLNPEGFLKISQANEFKVSYAGSEANVAVGLANLGLKVSFITKVPDNDIGKNAIYELRKYGIDISDVLKGGYRLGIYYLEKGASQRASKVIYDRKYSSIATSNSNEYNWENIFEDATWFHFSGITPALGTNVAQICLEACKIAKSKGITISCDLNYRNKLWSREKAKETISSLMKYVDICIGNEEDIKDVFGLNLNNTDLNKGDLNLNCYIENNNVLIEKFELTKVAISLRESISASENNWSAFIQDKTGQEFSRKYKIKIVDRVGTGDAFAAGIIYSIIKNYNDKNTIEFASAASCLKHSIEGDFNIITLEEIESLINCGGSGRIER